MTVDLDGSTVRGTSHGDVRVYWGIPFARPPVGPLRLAPPQPAELPRIVDATRPRASAPQPTSKIGVRLGLVSPNQDDDCLHANVWTNAEPGAARPVLVWIHGGSFDAGNGTTPVTQAERLVERTGAVVVSIQYRLGAIGFLSVPGAPDNRGLLDQLAALRFVQRHVAAFGGDPDNVTLVGWSAGAVSALLLAVMPEAKGLFRRVIAQSGHIECLHAPPEARRVREAVFAALGWPPELEPDEARTRLESISAFELVRAQERAERRLAGLLHALPFMPTYAGVHPFERYAAGDAQGIDFIIGGNRDEMKLERLGELGRPFDDEELESRVDALLSSVRHRRSLGPQLIELYRRQPHVTGHDPREVWAALASDYQFRYPAWRLARRAAKYSRVFAYDFTFRSPALGGVLGACHGIEVPLVFGTYDSPVMGFLVGRRPGTVTLSERIQDAWGAFAMGEDPRLPSGEPWPRLDDTCRDVTLIDEEWTVLPDGHQFLQTAWGPHWELVRPLNGGAAVRSTSIWPAARR